MDKVNPRFTLRNYLLEEAIRAADKEDFSLVEKLLELSNNPYSDEIVKE